MAHIFHSLIDTEQAKRLASENIAIQRKEESIDINDSLGRILCEDIRAPINTPPFNRAIKDGYAVRSGDVEGAAESSPVRLEILGSIDIGHAPRFSVGMGNCVKVPTGGVMPEGADSVVMVEYTHEEDESVMIYRPTTKGENIALAGSDIPEGELIIRKGTLVGAREIAVISSLGIPKIRVYGKINIGIVSTGDELMQPGEPASKGKIYESNGRTIKALLDKEGNLFNSTFHGNLPDVEETIRKKLDTMIDENDIVIVSGSTSAGEKDMVYRILGEYDPGTVFHGIKIKPGKPTLLSRRGDKIIIGLPGFPVSAMMTFLTIFFPFILREAGVSADESNISGTLAGKVPLDLGKLNLIPVSLAYRNGSYVAFPIHGGSGSISRLLRADGYISLKGDSRTAVQGDSVNITLFDKVIKKGKYTLTGEDASLLDTLSARSVDLIKVIKTGYYPSLLSVVNGYSDAAGIVHSDASLNESKGSEKDFGELVSLWSETMDMGIVFRKGSRGNYENIQSLLNSGERFAVPDKSQGTSRVLLSLVEKSGIPGDAFHPYASEVGNLNSVAFAVSEGYFDAGISDSATAGRYGLEFMKLGSYYYHILCRKDRESELSFIRDFLPPAD